LSSHPTHQEYQVFGCGERDKRSKGTDLFLDELLETIAASLTEKDAQRGATDTIASTEPTQAQPTKGEQSAGRFGQ
jgi:hypothetical protein